MAVAFALYPVSMNQLLAIADAGEIMPPKQLGLNLNYEADYLFIRSKIDQNKIQGCSWIVGCLFTGNESLIYI